MREILFKAKTCNGEWVQGLLANKDNKWYISNKAGQPFAYEVRPDTICQYTGLADKNGNKIWENDVIECKSNKNTSWNRHFLSQVVWDDGSTGFCFHDTTQGYAYMDSISDGGIFDCEVIGNIFDNADLVKE